MKGQRVRIVPPKEAEFTLTVQNDVDLAPGLDMSAELAYYSEAPNDIESTSTCSLAARTRGRRRRASARAC